MPRTKTFRCEHQQKMMALMLGVARTKGITVSDIAAKIGVSKPTMYHRFHYANELSLGDIRKIRKVLNIDPKELLDRLEL